MTAAAKTPGIHKKILEIRKGLKVEKTGWDAKNEYAYFKADDIAFAVRQGMNEHGVIHKVHLLDVIDGSRVDAQGRERSRFTTKSLITFIDVEDGSEFTHEVVASGSDIGGDKAPRKTAVQAFKIAAIDLFMVVEGLDGFDSDRDAEAEPEDLTVKAESKAAENARTIRELDQAVGKIIKDAANPVTAEILKSLSSEIATEKGISTDSKIWRKESSVMQPLAETLEKALDSLDKGLAENIEDAIKLARAGTGEVD